MDPGKPDKIEEVDRKPPGEQQKFRRNPRMMGPVIVVDQGEHHLGQGTGLMNPSSRADKLPSIVDDRIIGLYHPCMEQAYDRLDGSGQIPFFFIMEKIP